MAILLRIVLGMSLALIPHDAYALQLKTGWARGLCTFIPCSTRGPGALGLSTYIFDKIIPVLEVLFVAAAIVMLLLAAANMVLYSTDENVVKESRTAYYYAIVGAAIMGLSRAIVGAFAPSEVGAAYVDPSKIYTGIDIIVLFFKLLLAAALIANIVIQAVRLISSQGQQEQTDKAKKRLIAGFIGVAIVLLVNSIILAVLPGARGSVLIAAEIVGIANFILTLFGAAAVIAFIAAGIMLVVSVDEGLKDKAKTVIRTAIFAIVVVLASYSLVNTFIAFDTVG